MPETTGSRITNQAAIVAIVKSLQKELAEAREEIARLHGPTAGV